MFTDEEKGELAPIYTHRRVNVGTIGESRCWILGHRFGEMIDEMPN